MVSTLSEMLDPSRDGMGKKNVVCFENIVQISGVRTRNSWYNFTCPLGKCRKGLEHAGGYFKCTGCNKKVDYLKTRFRLELDVITGNTSIVVVLFDENTSPDAGVLPPIIEGLTGTKHVFQIKSLSYYHFGEYESFNCSKVTGRPRVMMELMQVDTNQQVGWRVWGHPHQLPLKRPAAITTPAKTSGRKLRKLRFQL
nr:uncharacterized protein LOC122578734 isoform X2 [Erigeron canadensis]